MKTTYNFRETLAWIVLACAAFLFSVTVAFAQDNDKSKKDKTTIRIVRKEDGKTTRVDTTINSADEEAIRKVFESLGIKNDIKFNQEFPEPPEAPATPGGEEDHQAIIGKYKHGMSAEQKAELKEEMKNLKEEMKGLHEKMKDIHIEIFSDKDGESGVNGFDFEMPPIPDVPETPGADDFSFYRNGCGKRFHFHSSGDEADSLGEGRVTIIGDEDEQPPVFERELKGKHGEKVFVYKRSIPEEKKAEVGAGTRNPIQLYPNPNDGSFSAKFHSESKSDIAVKVFDNEGKEVYSETLKNFDGDYSNTFNLESKGKGNYILKITQGDRVYARKFVIE